MSSEIAELMAVKSKHGAGGEYSPNWTPPVSRRSSPCLALFTVVPRTEIP